MHILRVTHWALKKWASSLKKKIPARIQLFFWLALHLKTRKKPQRDGRRGAIMIKSNLIIPGGWPTNWKISIPKKLFHGNEGSEPHVELHSLRAWQQKEASPENLALKDSGDWPQKFCRTGRNRNYTLGGCTQGLLPTRTQGIKQ